jgi:hypothetical protein
MNRRPVFSLLSTLLVGASLALSLPSSIFAQESQLNPPPQSSQLDQPASVNGRIARLSFTQGDVQVQRPEEDWQTASINLPLQQGFRLATTDGRAEIQFESGVILRLAEDSILEFTELDNGQNSGRITKLNLTQGTIIVTADLRPTDSFSVDAPNIHVTVQQPSRFRIDTTEGDSWVGIFAGDVMVKTERGETKVTKGHTFHISGGDSNQVSVDMNAAPDDFDQWAVNRDQSIQQGYRDAIQYVANYVPDYSEYNYGMSDLSSYGHWAVSAGCGLCWEPYGVPDHWRPFFFGRWEFFHGAGWSWISSEPWGWLPFHTGRWFARAGGGWIWQPGSIRAWNPAPVHWLNVGNQLAWAPAGTLNSHGQPPASGIVVGTRDVAETRGVRITPGVRPPLSSELTEKITRTNAPVVQQSIVQRSEFHAGATPVTVPPARPRNFPQDGVIRFDPATRTYMNSYPAPQPTPQVSPDNSANIGSGGGTAVPHRPVPMRPTNTIQRPAYIAPPAQPQMHPALQPHYTPPPQPAPHPSAPPAQPHSSPPPAPVHTSPSAPVHH